MTKPIIGILAKHKDIVSSRPNTFIRDELKDALISNGAIAIGILPPSKTLYVIDNDNQEYYVQNIDKFFSKYEQSCMVSQIKLCDGIVLAGGYMSDVYEMWVARYCYQHDIPLLAICAGQTNIVRILGGNIVKLPQPNVHYQPCGEYAHSITIDKNSKFYTIVKTETMMVNSRHCYTVQRTDKLDAVGYDDDGNIEVVEDKNKKFYLGVRFHPESLCSQDKLHNNIFRAFINATKK